MCARGAFSLHDGSEQYCIVRTNLFVKKYLFSCGGLLIDQLQCVFNIYLMNPIVSLVLI